MILEVLYVHYSKWSFAFTVVAAILIILYFRYYRRASLPTPGTTEWIVRKLEPKKLSFSHRYKLDRRDIIPIIAVALISAFLNYFALGENYAPQTFHQFNAQRRTVTVTLDEPTDVSGMMYYTGLWTGSYKLEFYSDGEWIVQESTNEDEAAMDQPHAHLFKWREAYISGSEDVTLIRITATKNPMELGELAIYDGEGTLMTLDRLACDAVELFDEQHLVPEMPTYMNGMYFDEIYHGRTAFEHIRNISPYEVSHPPLGKLIISIGIQLFGMTPFGWRFMGATFGWIMLVVLYIFLKNMFGKTPVALCGTSLFIFDFMRFTQTRIATIDTYGVFFIMLAYYFMYRYMTQPLDTKFGKTLGPLFLSGLFFGIGCASKWIVVYAGAGLAILYLIHQILRGKYYRENGKYGYCGYLIGTLLCSVVFFVIIPAAVYCLSYIPYGLAEGMTIKDGMLTNPEYYKIIWDNQVFMFSYHADLEATHSYSSVWWQWILDVRPMLYYRSYLDGGYKSAFAAFGNPVVWWGGCLAMIAMVVRVVKYRDSRALFILVGYLVQLIPWIIISRVVFIYHYFPCVLFIVMAIAHVYNTMWERKRGKYKLAVIGYTVAAALLFVMFYPVISGVPAPEDYTKYLLRWIPEKWPF